MLLEYGQSAEYVHVNDGVAFLFSERCVVDASSDAMNAYLGPREGARLPKQGPP
jgi:hypothetical protein